jgi:hypothetical protein
MAGSTLDPDNLAQAGKSPATQKGHDTRSLGPSDSSDSGSDMAGPGLIDADSDTDRSGTGEHLTAGREPGVRPDQDRDTDRVVAAEEAGLGGGLDQAEEARLGVTDAADDEA